jgi:methanogenic corrinoid protein MtbC1
VTSPPAGAADRFFDALAAADRAGALAVAEELVAGGMDPIDVLHDVVVPAQQEVGRRWQTGEWTVAQEHAATAISESVVAAVAGRAAVTPHRGRVVVTCVEEEWHALPARLLAETLALAGWDVTFLGASTPPTSLGGFLHDLAPEAVAISCSVATGLPRARAMIEAAHEAGALALVGGRGFGADGRLADRLGADVWAPTAKAAVRALEDPPPRQGPRPVPEHAGLDEHAELSLRRARVVEAAFALLGRRFPPLARFDAQQVARTREDLGYIVDFLGTAVYADDPALFEGFTDWLQDLLTSRGVPESALAVSYDCVAEAVGDLPLASGVLARARARLP